MGGVDWRVEREGGGERKKAGEWEGFGAPLGGVVSPIPMLFTSSFVSFVCVFCCCFFFALFISERFVCLFVWGMGCFLFVACRRGGGVSMRLRCSQSPFQRGNGVGGLLVFFSLFWSFFSFSVSLFQNLFLGGGGFVCFFFWLVCVCVCGFGHLRLLFLFLLIVGCKATQRVFGGRVCRHKRPSLFERSPRKVIEEEEGGERRGVVGGWGKVCGEIWGRKETGRGMHKGECAERVHRTIPVLHPTLHP